MIVLVLLVLLFTGISLFHTPAYEVVYSYRWIVMPAGDGRNTVFCALDVGNTGRKPQEDVKIHFLRLVLNHAVIPPTAKNFDVVERAITISQAGMRTTLSLGRLEPGKRVTVSILLMYSSGALPPAWETAFRGVEPSRGKAKVGDPGLTAAGRGVFTVFTDFLPF